jgi:hypothetical protein
VVIDYISLVMLLVTLNEIAKLQLDYQEQDAEIDKFQQNQRLNGLHRTVESINDMDESALVHLVNPSEVTPNTETASHESEKPTRPLV